MIAFTKKKKLFLESRVSGTGTEYGGNCRMSSSQKECKLWDKEYKLEEGYVNI